MDAIGIAAGGGGRAAAPFLAMLSAMALLAGCKVMTIEQDRALRARQGATFDAAAEVRRLWAGKALPALDRAAAPMAQLVPAMDADLQAAGRRFGRQTGEGAPWTFVGRGSGVVTAVDMTSRRGTIEIALAGMPAARTIRLQIGPVVSGTAIRDALPFLTFNDSSDQLAFADIGRALTAQSLSALHPRLAALRPGDRVSFTGAFNIGRDAAVIVLTPIALAPAPPHAG